MKIAILTLPLGTNNGGILQAYALQTVLERMGHQVEVLNFRRPLVYIWLGFVKDILLKLIGKRKGYLLGGIESYYKYPKLAHESLMFINSHIHYSHAFSSKRHLSSFALSYDAFIVGSDQVWRKKYAQLPLDCFYLSFVPDNKIKISYAASFGINYSDYIEKDIVKCGESFQRLNAVSLRESSGIGLIKDVFRWKPKGECIEVLDPTLLMGGKDYINLFGLLEIPEVRERKLLFQYSLDQSSDLLSVLEDMKSSYDLNRLDPYDIILKRQGVSLPSPIEWMNNILQSDIVLTDSFHCCVFSILFHKLFIVFCNEKRGNTRLESLLSNLGLKERMIFSKEEYVAKKETLLHAIDYDFIEKLLNEKRERSIQFLKRNLV